MSHRDPIEPLPLAVELDGFAQDVKAGLLAKPKRLSCRFFYDDVGSKIFEEICSLPEYYLTHAEQEILTTNADAIVDRLPTQVSLLELGSGSATKTRLLIEALINRQGKLLFVPIDIAPTILDLSSRDLQDYFAELEVCPVPAEYQEGLVRAGQVASGPKLILWLGSNVGNFERVGAAHFMSLVRQTMSSDDRLVVGIDLRKDVRVLEAAYDDATGVTARFNLNILDRINRELGGTFALGEFRHEAIYNEDEGRVEMYLVSDTNQEVYIASMGCAVDFAREERIHTENSYKYSLAEIDVLADRAGFCLEEQWFDPQGRFSLNMFANG